MDENLIGKIVCFLLKKNNFQTDIETLYKNGVIDNLARFNQWIEHDLNFVMMENKDNKSLIYFIPIPTCHNESLEYCCNDKFCKKIHFSKGDICWFYIYEDSCKFGKKCSNKHTLRDCELIRTRGLDHLNDVTLKNLLKLSKIFEIKFCRSIETCLNLGCTNLHCCFHYYIFDDCKQNENECKHGHNINVHLNHNLKVLNTRNIDIISNENGLKTYLISAYFGVKKKRKNSLQLADALIDIPKVNILHQIVSFLIENNAFHVDLSFLCNQIQISLNEVCNFIRKDQHNFLLFDKFDTKKQLLFIPISMCTYETSNSECSNKLCKKFHINKNNLCWFYLFDGSCKFADDCGNKHNARSCSVIKERGLHTLDDNILRKVLQLSKLLATKFCRAKLNQCLNKDCESLHCCYYHFILNSCKDVKCSYGHSIGVQYKKNEKFLEQHGLSALNNEQIKIYIESSYTGIKISDKCVSKSIDTPGNFPEFWTTHVNFAINLLHSSSSEYIPIQNKLKSFLKASKRSIKAIHQVQNLPLWNTYQFKMFSMKEKYKNAFDVQEFYAFFALSSGHSSYEEVCEKGLNESLITNGGYLGSGYYFAKDPMSLILRSQPDAVLFYVRLFLANCLKLTSPLSKLNQSASNYDSVMDESNEVFCIFDKNHVILLNLVFTK